MQVAARARRTLTTPGGPADGRRARAHRRAGDAGRAARASALTEREHESTGAGDHARFDGARRARSPRTHARGPHDGTTSSTRRAAPLRVALGAGRRRRSPHRPTTTRGRADARRRRATRRWHLHLRRARPARDARPTARGRDTTLHLGRADRADAGRRARRARRTRYGYDRNGNRTKVTMPGGADARRSATRSGDRLRRYAPAGPGRRHPSATGTPTRRLDKTTLPSARDGRLRATTRPGGRPAPATPTATTAFAYAGTATRPRVALARPAGGRARPDARVRLRGRLLTRDRVRRRRGRRLHLRATTYGALTGTTLDERRRHAADRARRATRTAC